MNGLLKKASIGLFASALALGLGVGISKTAQPVETKAAIVAGTYTYDLVTNFVTYASAWSSSYAARTVTSENVEATADALPNATIGFSSANKQTATITTMPVSKACNTTFTLTESGFEITSVTVKFAQWTTKVPSVSVYTGTGTSGTALLTSSAVGLTATGATLTEGTTGTLAIADSGVTSLYIAQTTTNQVGWKSIDITIAASSAETLVDSISLSPSPAYIKVGGSQIFAATVLPSNATDSTVSWSLIDVSPAGCATWTSANLTVTAVSVGTATLKAEANDESGKSATASIIIHDDYSVTFTVAADVTTALTSSTIATYLSGDGSSFTYSTLTGVYAQATNRIKLGTSSAAGQFDLKTPDGLVATSVVLELEPWNGDTATVSVNDGTAVTLGTAKTYYTFDLASASKLISIKGTTASKGRFYISNIVIATENDSAALLASYVMIAAESDTDTGACDTTFPLAKERFLVLTVSEQALFQTAQEGESATITSARARYVAWASHLAQKPWEAGAVSSALSIFGADNSTSIAVTAVAVIGFITVGAFFFLTRKHKKTQD